MEVPRLEFTPGGKPAVFQELLLANARRGLPYVTHLEMYLEGIGDSRQRRSTVNDYRAKFGRWGQPISLHNVFGLGYAYIEDDGDINAGELETHRRCLEDLWVEQLLTRDLISAEPAWQGSEGVWVVEELALKDEAGVLTRGPGKFSPYRITNRDSEQTVMLLLGEVEADILRLITACKGYLDSEVFVTRLKEPDSGGVDIYQQARAINAQCTRKGLALPLADKEFIYSNNPNTGFQLNGIASPRERYLIELTRKLELDGGIEPQASGLFGASLWEVFACEQYCDQYGRALYKAGKQGAKEAPRLLRVSYALDGELKQVALEVGPYLSMTIEYFLTANAYRLPAREVMSWLAKERGLQRIDEHGFLRRFAALTTSFRRQGVSVFSRAGVRKTSATDRSSILTLPLPVSAIKARSGESIEEWDFREMRMLYELQHALGEVSGAIGVKQRRLALMEEYCEQKAAAAWDSYTIRGKSQTSYAAVKAKHRFELLKRLRLRDQ